MPKALGIVRKLDELGRVVIPMEVRRTQGWEQGQPLEMFMDGDTLMIKSYQKDEQKQEAVESLEVIEDIIGEDETGKEMIANLRKFLKG